MLADSGVTVGGFLFRLVDTADFSLPFNLSSSVNSEPVLYPVFLRLQLLLLLLLLLLLCACVAFARILS